jgi:hypothetical protein
VEESRSWRSSHISQWGRGTRRKRRQKRRRRRVALIEEAILVEILKRS